MLLVDHYYKYLTFFSAGIDYRRQILTTVGVILTSKVCLHTQRVLVAIQVRNNERRGKDDYLDTILFDQKKEIVIITTAFRIIKI